MLAIEPNTPQVAVVNYPICFEASGTISLAGDPDYRPLEIGASGTGWTYNSSTALFTKTGGATLEWVRATSTDAAYSVQPFWIRFSNAELTTPAPPNNWYGGYVGVQDSDGFKYWIEVVYDPTASYWYYAARYEHLDTNGNTVVTTAWTHNASQGDVFYVWSTGTHLSFERWGGFFQNHYLDGWAMELPVSDTWNFIIGAGAMGNRLSDAKCRFGTYQGTIPITWSAPLGGTLTGTGNTRCFTHDVPGSYQICVDSDIDDPICVDIEVDDLYFVPEDFDCGGCVFVNEVVHFESNGGQAGTLTVIDIDDEYETPIGTVIDSLTWQAPGYPVHALATYTLGDYEVTCEINVVEEFKVINIEGDTLTGLVPGDTFQILTNYPLYITLTEERPWPPPDLQRYVEWSNLDCQGLISPEGVVTIPRNYRDECFGAIDCYVRGTVKYFPGATCPNFMDGSVYKDIRIIVNPIYPTPEFGGPRWEKWTPEVPDFRVLSKTSEGGCMETHIRNKVPTMRWTASYRQLKYIDPNPCSTESCCDDEAGFVGGFDPKYQTAKVIDDFWMLVAGNYGTFTLIDPRDGTVWQNVRFENKMERDHINWKTNQSRTVTMIWAPCCATWPLGGSCIHTRTIKDNIVPTIPQNLTAIPVSYDRIDVQWDTSIDNVGIKRYELEINGAVVDVGHKWIYHNTGLQPLSTYFYRVRAVDYSNNKSDWSDEIQATTLAGETAIVEGTEPVYEGADQIVEG